MTRMNRFRQKNNCLKFSWWGIQALLSWRLKVGFRAIRYQLMFMVRSGAEWSAEQVLVGVGSDWRQGTGAVIGNDDQVSRAVLTSSSEASAPLLSSRTSRRAGNLGLRLRVREVRGVWGDSQEGGAGGWRGARECGSQRILRGTRAPYARCEAGRRGARKARSGRRERRTWRWGRVNRNNCVNILWLFLSLSWTQPQIKKCNSSLIVRAPGFILQLSLKYISRVSLPDYRWQSGREGQ